jgi:hypothetical protein
MDISKNTVILDLNRYNELMTYEKFALEDIEENAIYINRDYGGITKYNILTTDECLKEIGEKYNFVLENTVSLTLYNDLRDKNKILDERNDELLREVNKMAEDFEIIAKELRTFKAMSVKEFKEYKKNK